MNVSKLALIFCILPCPILLMGTLPTSAEGTAQKVGANEQGKDEIQRKDAEADFLEDDALGIEVDATGGSELGWEDFNIENASTFGRFVSRLALYNWSTPTFSIPPEEESSLDERPAILSLSPLEQEKALLSLNRYCLSWDIASSNERRCLVEVDEQSLDRLKQIYVENDPLQGLSTEQFCLEWDAAASNEKRCLSSVNAGTLNILRGAEEKMEAFNPYTRSTHNNERYCLEYEAAVGNELRCLLEVDSKYIERNPLSVILATIPDTTIVPPVKGLCPNGTYQEWCAKIAWSPIIPELSSPIDLGDSQAELLDFDFSEWLKTTKQENSREAFERYLERQRAARFTKWDGVLKQPLTPGIARQKAFRQIEKFAKEKGPSTAFNTVVKQAIKRLVGGPYYMLYDLMKPIESGKPNDHSVENLTNQNDNGTDLSRKEQKIQQIEPRTEDSLTVNDRTETITQMEIDRVQNEKARLGSTSKPPLASPPPRPEPLPVVPSPDPIDVPRQP